MPTSNDVDRLLAICPTFRFRAKHTLDVSDAELDEIIRASAGRIGVDDIEQIVDASAADDQASDPPATAEQPPNDWRCGWTISDGERNGSR